MTVYIEYLSLRTFLLSALKELLGCEVRNDKAKVHYYFDASRPGKTFAYLFGKLIGFQVKKLEFEMRHVKDERGELIRLRIPGKDLFEIQKQIINSEAYRHLYLDEWKQTRVDDFIKKGLTVIEGGITKEKSASRALYLIQVVAWHQQKMDESKAKLLLSRCAWWNVFEQYASRAGISLKRISNKRALFIDRTGLQEILRKYPRLYIRLKSFKSGRFRIKPTGADTSSPKLYVFGRGDINLENNGDHSDFFWLLNSKFPAGKVLYDFHSEKEKLVLEHHGIVVANSYVKHRNNDNTMMASLPKKNRRYEEEFKILKSLISSYNSIKADRVSFFQTYGVKVYSTWYACDTSHMAIADAIREVGGIFTVWQNSFVGHRDIEMGLSADIVFSYSNFSDNIERQQGSKIKYHVITGYPKDHAAPLLRKEALDLRAKLQSNGAEKVVFAIDENSMEDSRWHTGHTLQRENYSFILEKVLVTPWLGVVFKPKIAKTLRRRLGEVADLLTAAEKTGRCYIYEVSGRHTTSVPPILAGLSADVCIHGHLAGGTAALECALQGIPTLLIDREGCPDSKLYELPVGKVIFRNWPEAIDAVMDHFKTSQGIPGFGDWSEIIDELDPFRDGKAANRIGTYMHWLIQGYEKGLDRESIMANAAERYSKIWGSDKVMSINS
jgi:hypothetical protein